MTTYACDECNEEILEPHIRSEMVEQVAGKMTVYAEVMSCPFCGSYSIHIASIEDDILALNRMVDEL